MCHIFDKGDSFKEWSTLSSLDHIWLGQSFTATLLHGSSLSTLISKGHFEWASFQVSEPMLVKKKKQNNAFTEAQTTLNVFPLSTGISVQHPVWGDTINAGKLYAG